VRKVIHLSANSKCPKIVNVVRQTIF
jgi:hypothetical protein